MAAVCVYIFSLKVAWIKARKGVALAVMAELIGGELGISKR
jgi:hypothetical protein